MNLLSYSFVLVCIAFPVISSIIQGREPQFSTATRDDLTTWDSPTAPWSSTDAGTTTCWTPIEFSTETVIVTGEPSSVTIPTAPPTITPVPSDASDGSTSDWIGGTAWCSVTTLPGTSTIVTVCS
ncbi:hypothetical protein QCA50_013443 [Cerrena zonata]|uniref:Uncharacterized protein n=1 Tax=Cerrena zonata TaxID=2478898 RepID=A0AAW0G3H4_9APHY